ncbi:MAG: hypothetical protein CTY16_14780 [Methylobacter sp.]|nr:MAG: hypothetical protein CTY16_14780 [Methylobacter sp.]
MVSRQDDAVQPKTKRIPLRNQMSNEAEPMPRAWTSDMTGQIYPVGGVQENPAIQKICRRTPLFLIF